MRRKSPCGFDLRHGHHEFNGCGVHEWRRSQGVGEDLGILSIEHHEGTPACRAVNLIVMGKFSEGEPIAPVCQSVIDEDPEVLLDLLVDLFGLAVRLRVEGGRCVWHDIEHLIKFLHELGDELWSPVRDYSRQHSMLCIDMIAEDSGPSLG